MGLFEEVQKELLSFFPPRPKAFLQTPVSLDELPCKVIIERRPHKRSLSFQMQPKGHLKVLTNKSISETEVLSLLKPHFDWILAQYELIQSLKEHHPQKLWQTGEHFLLNGEAWPMTLTSCGVKRPFIRFMSSSFEFFYPTKWDLLAPFEKHLKLKTALLNFFKTKASEILNECVHKWSKIMELYPRQVTYRNPKARWGSCSSQGKVSFNWKLACFSPKLQDYVVVHELAHLKHQNHSRQFWNLVEQHIPNRKELEKQLHHTQYKVDCFLKKSELFDQNPTFPTS